MERIVEQFRQMESLRGKQFVHIDLIEEDLCKWKVGMKFGEGSRLQKELDHYGEKVLADKTRKSLEVRVYFPHDYPKCAPEVRVHEPRLAEECPLVTFGGVFKTVLLGTDWDEKLTAKDVLLDIHLRMSMLEVTVAPQSRLLRPYEKKPASQDPVSLRSSLFPTVNNFDMKFKVIAAKEASNTFKISDLDESDRICLPAELMAKLYTEHTKLPIIFEIETQEGRVRHMGISDKHAFVEYLPRDTIIVPDWIHDELKIPHKSMCVNLRCVQLKPVEHLQLQPHSASFYKDVEACSSEIGSNQAILNRAMKDSKLTALTVNTAVKIEVPKPGGAVSHLLEIINVHPPGAGRVIASGEEGEWDISFKVDFAPAPDFEDEEDYKKRMAEVEGRMLVKEKAKERRRAEMSEAKKEELSNLVMMQRLELEDEMPSVGKRGDIDVKLTFPDGKQLDGKFKEGSTVASITAFIMINADWVIDSCVERSTITLSTTYPKKQLYPTDPVTKATLHRQRVMVSRTAPEDSPSSPTLDPSEHTEHDVTMIERSGTDRLEAAWENATQMQKVRRTMRSEEAIEAARITEMADIAEPLPVVSGGDGDGGPPPEERAAKIQMVSEISGNPDPGMVESILQACDWDPDRAVSLLFEH